MLCGGVDRGPLPLLPDPDFDALGDWVVVAECIPLPLPATGADLEEVA